jgi:hypothetical protein
MSIIAIYWRKQDYLRGKLYQSIKGEKNV